jgi:hypothetical protein
MELLTSFFDFLLGLFTGGGHLLAEKKRKRPELLSFKHYIVIFVIFLAVLFYFYS